MRLPVGKRPETGLLALRKGLGLYVNLRPVRLLEPLRGISPLRPERLGDLDIEIVRELGRRNVLRRTRQRGGRWDGAGVRYGVVLDAGNRAHCHVCVSARGEPLAAAVFGGQGERADQFAIVEAHGDNHRRCPILR